MKRALATITDFAPCSICGNAIFRRHGEALSFDPFHGPVHLVKCSRCGLVRIDPLPSDEDLSPLYDAAYYTNEKKNRWPCRMHHAVLQQNPCAAHPER